MTSQVGTVYMDVEFDTNKMARDLSQKVGRAAVPAASALTKSFDQQLSAFSQKTTKFGREFTTGVSLPVAGLAGVATKSFSGFESSMTKITGLVGVSREQTQAWSGDVRQIAQEFGITGKEAADALYFITSSGLQGSQAIDALRISAKASAAGLGETSVIADLVTSSLNAYAGTGLTAAKATDVLTAAVRTGKSEPDELANSMGRVLPISANLGVSFDQVAAAMAAMSLTGTDADEAATQLRGILNALLKPSVQAEEALGAVGLSSAELRKQIAEKGLLPTLKTLVSTLGDDSAATALVFDDTRALTGAMNLLGKNSGQTEAIFKDVAAASGDLDRAFQEQSKTTEFKMKKAWSEANDALIGLGESIGPTVANVLTAASKIGTAFNGLPDPIKAVVTTLGGVAIVVGPAAYGIGKVAGAVSSLSSNTKKLLEYVLEKRIAAMSNSATGATDSIGGMNSKLAAGTIVVAGLATAYVLVTSEMAKVQAEAAKLTDIGNKRTNTATTFKELQDRVAIVNRELQGLAKANEDARFDPVDRAAYGAQADALRLVGEQAAKYAGQAQAIAAATGLNVDKAAAWVVEQGKAGRTFIDGTDALNAYNEAQKTAATTTDTTTTAVGLQRQQVAALSQPFFALTSAQDSYSKALRGVDDALRSMDNANRGVLDANRALADSHDRVQSAERRRVQALESLREAQQSAADAQRALDDALNGPSEDDQLSLEEAQLGLARAKQSLRTGKFKDPLDRKEAVLAVRRAENALKEAQARIDGRVAEAEKNLHTAQERVTDAQQSAADAAKGVSDANRGVEDAARAVIDAQQAQVDATNAINDAQTNAVTAALDLLTKQEGLATALLKGQTNALPFLASLEEMKRLYPEVAAELQKYIDKFNLLNPGYHGDNPDGTPSGKGIGPPNPNAPGYTGPIGYHGDNPDGTPSGAGIGPPAPRTVDASTTRGDNTWNINVTGQDQPKKTAFEIRSEMRWLARGTR